MEADNQTVGYLESRKLVKRWSGPWPAVVNLAMILAIFGVTWWIFQDPRGILRMYTPYLGYMYCRWLLILFIWMAYILDFWPFKREWLNKTHPVVKGLILTAVCVVAMEVLIKGFFMGLLGKYGIAYFSPERLHALGVTEFYAEEYATEAIMMFAAIASWLAPAWVVACENAPWQKMPQPVRGMTVMIITFFLATLVYFLTMHSHMAILFYPWQQYSAITPPYWEGFANTVSGNFHIAWIMCCTVTVWVYESIWERYPFNLIKTDWLRRLYACASSCSTRKILRGGSTFVEPAVRWLPTGVGCMSVNAQSSGLSAYSDSRFSVVIGQPSSAGRSMSFCEQSSVLQSGPLSIISTIAMPTTSWVPRRASRTRNSSQ